MTQLGVVGGGTMGAGIAEIAIRAGDDVLVLERDQAAADAARARIEKSINRAVSKSKISADDAVGALLGRLDAGHVPGLDAPASAKLAVVAAALRALRAGDTNALRRAGACRPAGGSSPCGRRRPNRARAPRAPGTRSPGT